MIRCTVINAHPHRRLRIRRYEETVYRVLRLEGVRNAEVSVVFTTDAATRRMNRRWLGKRGTTDVLSFPLGDPETLEGEVYVNVDRAEVQARDYAVPAVEEVLRLVIHGVLHLVGYDDGSPGPARRMKQREDLFVRRLMRQSRNR